MPSRSLIEELREIRQRISPTYSKELDEAIRHLGSSANVFVFCLSVRGDLLSQWRAYGEPGNGYSIGFDAPALDEIIRRREGMQLAAVCYDPQAQWDLMNRMEIQASETL
jgi:hypothetical protein